MTVDPRHPSTVAPVRIVEADGRHAVLAFSGDLDSPALRELEELLLDRRLVAPTAWTLDMSGLEHIDLACAYALLRAVTRVAEPASISVRGARPAVHRTLKHAGLDTVVAYEH
ncbi:STAS domain-containing protein [Streptomyces sp. NPDC057148]|uniref:STAS domain-containing protein n=1 Tax=unclassified Streptomyces TaxID=2593676 RepID=UPI00363082BE